MSWPSTAEARRSNERYSRRQWREGVAALRAGAGLKVASRRLVVRRRFDRGGRCRAAGPEWLATTQLPVEAVGHRRDDAVLPAIHDLEALAPAQLRGRRTMNW